MTLMKRPDSLRFRSFLKFRIAQYVNWDDTFMVLAENNYQGFIREMTQKQNLLVE